MKKSITITEDEFRDAAVKASGEVNEFLIKSEHTSISNGEDLVLLCSLLCTILHARLFREETNESRENTI